MADIRVRFEVNPNAESEVLGDINNVNADTSNVSVKTNSSNVFQNIPTSESNGINGLSFAQDLVFDDEGYLDNQDFQGGVLDSEQNPTEFVWGVVPENKQYSVKLTFTNAKNLKDIIVYGDMDAKQYPTRVVIDGSIEITNDDNKWAINLQNESDTHTIEFTHWNRANYNACLTLIRVMMRYFEVDSKNGLKSVESLHQLTGIPETISSGIIENSGSATILDVNGEIRDMIESEVMSFNGMNVDVIANGKPVQHHTIDSSSYSVDGKSLTISLSNLADSKYSLTQRRIEVYQNTLYSFLLDVFIKLGLGDYSNLDKINELTSQELLDYDNSEISVFRFLNRINITAMPHDLSMIDYINSLLGLARLYLYIDDSGNYKLMSSRPIILPSEKIIQIPKSKCVSILDYDLFIENKYNNVQLSRINIDALEGVAFDRQYSIVDADGNFTLEFVDSSAKFIYDSNGNRILCFFLTVTSDNPIFNFKSDSSNIQVVINGQQGRFQYNSRLYRVSEQSKSDFVFDSTIRSARITELRDEATLNSHTFAVQVNLTDITNNISPHSINLTLYSDIYSKNDSTISYGINNSQNVFEVQSNEFLNSLCTYTSGSGDVRLLDEAIANSIIDDYKNGIHTARISVVCSDYYDTLGEKIKDWNNGDKLEVGELVKIYSNDRVWRITGRNFRKTGVPIIDLELQENIFVEPVS